MIPVLFIVHCNPTCLVKCRCTGTIHCALQLPRERSQHPVSVLWPLNPVPLVLQSITTYCGETVCGHISLSCSAFLSLPIYLGGYLKCLPCVSVCLSFLYSFPSLRSSSAVTLLLFFPLRTPLSASALCCVSAVEVRLQDALCFLC